MLERTQPVVGALSEEEVVEVELVGDVGAHVDHVRRRGLAAREGGLQQLQEEDVRNDIHGKGSFNVVNGHLLLSEMSTSIIDEDIDTGMELQQPLHKITNRL